MDPTGEAVGYQHVTIEIPQSRCLRGLAANGENVSARPLRPTSTVRSGVCEEIWANSQTMYPTPSSIHYTGHDLHLWSRGLRYLPGGSSANQMGATASCSTSVLQLSDTNCRTKHPGGEICPRRRVCEL